MQKQIAALENDVPTVTTLSLFGSQKPLRRYDVEPLIARVVDDTPRLDTTLGIWFGSGNKRALESTAPVGYSSDPEIADRACLLMYIVRRKDGTSEKREANVSLRSLGEGFADTNSIPSSDPRDANLIYFHALDMRLLHLVKRESVLVFPDYVFSSDSSSVDFWIRRQR